MAARDVPLLPDPDRARELLRRELLDPAYQTDNPIRRLLDQLDRVLSGGVGRVGAIDGVSLLLTLALVLALVLAIGWLVSRVRRDPARRTSTAAVVEETGVDAAVLRRRAETALAEGRHAEALTEGFRALTLRQHEAGTLAEQPSSTVSEVAAALARAHPERGEAIRAAALGFDAVRYGGRLPTAEQARAVLLLDDDLTARTGVGR